MTETVGQRPVARRGPGRLVPLLVLGIIALAIALPSLLARRGPDPLEPLELPAVPQPPNAFPAAATRPREADPGRRTLVLYDRTGKWGWLGELYATMAGNLASHFGSWSAKPVREYRAGELQHHDAVVYLGSTFNEPLPKAFLDDVVGTKRPVLWLGSNLWQLERRAGNFEARYGFATDRLDRSRIGRVTYKGTTLTRRSTRTAGIMTYTGVDTSRVRVLAQAIRPDRTAIPWALRSRNLTYIGEIPFPYTSETDRVLAFHDLLFDLLAPRTRERHRALVRLEDITPVSDPADLRAAADFLHSEGIPFGFGVSPRYRDLHGKGDTGEPQDLLLRDAPELVETIRYLRKRGGVLVGHGYTHQWDGGENPYNGVSGDDVEFYRATETPGGRVHYAGPVPGDSLSWSDRRIAYMEREFQAAGLALPRIFEFPHYAASPSAYRAAARRYAVRWERSLYFGGLLRGGRADTTHVASQAFPFVVRDVYGSKVLPENLGSIEPQPWHSYPARRPADIIEAAKANLVVRDGFASFFFHPFLDVRYLKRTVAGIEKLGYTFVSPASL
jgi:uncharacterized protein YdaL